MRTALILSSVIALAAADWPTAAPAAGQSVRLIGDQSPATQSGDLWRWGKFRTEAPLPVGYNAPTPNGAIELKTYPSVRRAEVDSNKLFFKGVFGQSRAFWKLFNHIKGRNIAMTAPVEFNFRNSDNARKFLGDTDWIMSFLYRTPEQGATGTDGDVVIIDRPEITVISVGVEGGLTNKLLSQGVDTLKAALASQSTWVAAGEPRFFGYNSPNVNKKWAEVQIPVRLA
jgi:hypothetical protein